MALFAYEVITKTGELLKGQLEAADEYAVADNLRKIGHTVIDIVEIKPSFFQNAFKAKVKASVGDLSLLCRQLAAMLDAGVPLTRSLFTLSIQTTNKGLGRILEEIARNIEGGMSFTDAISAYPHIFPSIFSGMVKAGEVGGTLEEALGRLADQLQKDKFLRDSLRSATFYPAAIGIFSVLLLLGMLFFLVPLFMGFFPPGTPLPLPTKIVVALSNSLRSLWYLWFLTVFLLEYCFAPICAALGANSNGTVKISSSPFRAVVPPGSNRPFFWTYLPFQRRNSCGTSPGSHRSSYGK